MITGMLATFAAIASAPTSALSCAQGPYIIFFDHGNAFVDGRARVVLDYAVSSVGNCGYALTYIAGHTDTSEIPSLADKRARVVKAYFAARGVPEDDITTLGMGAAHQRIPTGPDVREEQNRRVEITFGPLE